MRLILAALLGGILLSALPAEASICGPRDRVLWSLKKNYREQPIAHGLTNTGGVAEVIVSPNGGTWTILLTMPDGMTCLLAAGENWEKIHPTPNSREGSY